MLQFNTQEASRYIGLLTGDVNSPVTFQIFYDPKGTVNRKDLATTFTSTLTDAMPTLLQKQQELCGIYVTVNETAGSGRTNLDVTRYRAVFIDFDGQYEPTWAIEPSFVAMRDDTHGHAYWLINEGEINNKEDFRDIQKHLSFYYDSDPRVIDAARVLRLPGSVHLKHHPMQSQYVVTKISARVNVKYSIKDILDAHLLDAEKDAALNQWIATRKGIQSGEGYTNDPRYKAMFTKWCDKIAEPAVEGSGSETLIRVALYGHDHGLSEDVATPILWQHYNPRCIPPWDETEEARAEFNEIVERAYFYSTSAPGNKTAVAMFSALAPLPDPIEGWDKNLELADEVKAKGNTVDSDRIKKFDGELLLAQCTMKSSHYDLARAFDAMEFNGTKILRSDKTFYVYGGKSWQEVSDDVIKAKIQRFFSEFKPNDTFTRGVFNVFCDLVNVPNIKNGMWLNDPDRDTNNTIVFKNGIIDLDAPNLFHLNPHDHNYFTFNHLPYDFIVGEECPTWEKFLESIWPGNQANKDMIQEFMGYCLVHNIDLQKMLLLIGKSRGGKGLITRVIAEVVGRANMSSPSLSNLTKDSTLHAMSTSSVALIPDAHSVGHNLRDSTLSILKALTGGDSITFHEMYKGGKTVTMKCKLIMSANGMPEFVDSSGALSNRMLVAHFTRSFAGIEDVHLGSRLSGETAGIAQWAIQGLLRLRANDGVFTESEESKIEREEMKEDMFPLAQFINTNCVINSGAVTSVDDLYNAYQLYASLNGVRMPLTKIQFSKTLRNSDLPLKMIRPMVNGYKVRSFLNIKIDPITVDRMHVKDGKFPAVKDHV